MGWVLRVVASMRLIGTGLARTLFFIWAPETPMLEAARAGNSCIFAGSGLCIVAGVWSHYRGDPVWVSICVALPGVLVGWSTLMEPYSLLRHLAAVVAFPLAVCGVAEVIWASGRRQRR